MKAIEYYKKYKDANFAGDNDSLYNLLMEFNDESTDLIKKRNAKRDSALLAIIKEQNLKWNALCNLFEKNLGTCPLKKDGFKAFWSKKFEVEI